MPPEDPQHAWAREGIQWERKSERPAADQALSFIESKAKMQQVIADLEPGDKAYLIAVHKGEETDLFGTLSLKGTAGWEQHGLLVEALDYLKADRGHE